MPCENGAERAGACWPVSRQSRRKRKGETMAKILSTRAMLASLHIRTWSGRKLDKRVTDQTNRDHGADANAGRYNKLLVPAGALKPIMEIGTAARTRFYNITLPWLDSGSRIMTVHTLPEFQNEFREKREAFESARDHLLANYDDYKTQGERMLGDMFRPDDYPTAEDIRHRFSFKADYGPIPDADDFRADVPQSFVDEIKADLDRRSNDALRNAVNDIWQRVADCTQSMADKLTAYRPTDGDVKSAGIFRDSLVSNIADLAALLPSLNLTDDPRIATMARELADLADTTAGALRGDAGKREDKAAQAAAIASAVGAFMQ